jgi:hypothetical protein
VPIFSDSDGNNGWDHKYDVETAAERFHTSDRTLMGVAKELDLEIVQLAGRREDSDLMTGGFGMLVSHFLYNLGDFANGVTVDIMEMGLSITRPIRQHSSRRGGRA